ncbi:MAG: alpha-1,4-glucan--maltose-1-phosphate maltosyltransferase [Terriglobia bacterium]
MAIDEHIHKRVPSRVIITHVEPQLAEGAFPIKRVEGETLHVTADILVDGHEAVSAALRYRQLSEENWAEAPMRELGNDLWTAQFTVEKRGRYEYTIVAWMDDFETWRRDFAKRVEARQDLSVDLEIGARLVEGAARRAEMAGDKTAAEGLQQWAGCLCPPHLAGSLAAQEAPSKLAADERLASLMGRYPERRGAAIYEKCVPVLVDRARANFSAWYEMFPRSFSATPGRHGTFKDCESQLASIAGMGFDILYLPPIHPIGRTHRKGKNNSPTAGPEDVGSPWAIGAEEGGHKSVHPRLGTLEEFERFLRKAQEHGLEIALDLAYQCSPDHPYIRAHPEWFRRRPDGSLQYAENPPKKYEDIYPFDFDSDDWQSLWEELKSIVHFWIGNGVRIFRVDNPHTKPFAFWEWLIREIKDEYPDVLFLAEAFTRPKVMKQLAQLGFTQSYTYFTWRNTKWELIEYFTELTHTEMREYFRPNLWPNTPDILTEYLQSGGRPAFMARLVLAATLGANYGIYGPAFELCENVPIAPGKEEYLNAEKYEIRRWDLSRPGNLRDLIARVNRARRENSALQSDTSLHFHRLDNDQMIAYSKAIDDGSNAVLIVVNLDFRYPQSGWVDLSLEELGLDAQTPFVVDDLLTEARYRWQGPRNYVRLDPHVLPAHLFRIRRYAGSENGVEVFV